jgi:glycosyltransferase involved in cell wall biosynthesis
MKIVQAVGWFFPDTLGGTEVYVDGLSRRLILQGHDVRIAAPDPASRVEREYEHDGVRVFRYPIVAPRTRAEAQGRAPIAGAARFHAWIADQRPDLVHFHTLVPGLDLPAVRAARDCGARIVATTHASSLGYLCARGTMMHRGESPCDGLADVLKCAACELENRGVSKLLAEMIARVPLGASDLGRAIPGRVGTALGMPAMIAHNLTRQRELFDALDQFVVLTRWAKDAVVINGAPEAKVTINRLGHGHTNAAPKADPRRAPTASPIRIAYVGRFDPIKGPDVLARAFVSIRKDVPLRLDFRGPSATPDDEACLTKIRRLVAGDPRVTIGPAIPYADIPAYLSATDLVCCPSLCLEGGPTIAIESHAAGTPVIGSRIGGLAELITDGADGRLVAPGDWRALAQALIDVADDPSGTIDRWRAAIPRARSMDDVALDYLRVYAA